MANRLNTTLSEHYLIYNDFTGWQKVACDWYNTKIHEGFQHHKKQLFLWGGACLGKTRFFNFIFNRFRNEIYSPNISTMKRWQWEGFSNELHSVIFMDEFNMSNFDESQWKVIIDGGKFKIENKYQKQSGPMEMEAKMPVVMISNSQPTNLTTNTRRLEIIHVDEHANDKEYFNRPLRYVYSIDTADTPLTLEQVSAMPYNHPVVRPIIRDYFIDRIATIEPIEPIATTEAEKRDELLNLLKFHKANSLEQMQNIQTLLKKIEKLTNSSNISSEIVLESVIIDELDAIIHQLQSPIYGKVQLFMKRDQPDSFESNDGYNYQVAKKICHGLNEPVFCLSE